MSLNKSQMQCVLGTLIGDASIYWKRKSSFIYSVTHCSRQKGYLEHIRKKLDAPKTFPMNPKSGFAPKGSKYFKLNFQNKGALLPAWDIAYLDGKKTINEQWLDLIGPEAIAYWFMDDGSSSYSTSGRYFCRFSTQSFSYSEIGLLADLLSKYGITSNPNKCSGGSGRILNIPADSSEILMNLIHPYVSSIPCMNYKLKSRISRVIGDNNVKR